VNPGISVRLEIPKWTFLKLSGRDMEKNTTDYMDFHKLRVLVSKVVQQENYSIRLHIK